MSIAFRFKPKLLEALKGYDRPAFLRDASAGFTVGVLALPLAMAFAIASGVSPAAGLWTAIVAGLIISACGGSRVQIGGPTGAFIPILYSIVVAYGVSNMLAATFLAGWLLVALGLAGLGSLIRMIPVSVVIGFTNGIAVVIAISQLRDFFGLPVDSVPAEFFARWRVLSQAAPDLDPLTTLLAAGTFVFILLWSRVVKRIPRLGVMPAQLAGLLLGTLVASLCGLEVETLGSRFNGIPQGLPAFGFPLPSLEHVGKLLAPAITIALLGGIESLLSARVADAQINDRHDPNQELVAQGLANIVSPMVGGVAATGAIARTATNIRSGGRTPVAGIVHVLTLLIIVLVAAPLAAYVPVCVLAAIVMVTAWGMGEWHEFARLRHFSWNYRIILVSTFLLTVLFDLTIAVEIGMVLASLFFIYRMQDLTAVRRLHDGDGIAMFSLHGSLFFGSVVKLDAQMAAHQTVAQVTVLDLRDVLNIDTSGVDWLNGLRRDLHGRGGKLLLCAAGEQPRSLLQRSGFIDLLGAENVLSDREAALLHASLLIAQREAGGSARQNGAEPSGDGPGKSGENA
ncbi:SulP family inorganic anion transporter [Viridibacterium curvum]|uniref:Sulfate permease n=1 Tax=Viridibacterium curvum TaxID=1101404 RepID=A0ABP9R1R3_9RHOO